jgi:hypothetical protein
MLRVGFGRGVITPPLPVALAGFSGRLGPATEVHDDLEVQAVLLSSGGDAETVCLLVLDLLGMSREFAGPVREAVARELGLSIPAVLTSCIHTHAGPSCLAGAEQLGWPTPEGYLDVLVGGAVTAAVEARANLEPATLRHDRAPLPAGVSINRRGNPYDPWFSVVDARSERGDRLGTIANVSIHPVALGRDTLAVSSDWVGSFRSAYEASDGGRAVLLSGALGDVNPRPHAHAEPDGSFEHAEAVGREVAVAVSACADDAEEIAGDVNVEVSSVRTIQVPASGGLAALAGIERMDVELVEWTIGPLGLVSVPGEAFHALGNAIAASRDRPTLLAGISPIWQGYLPEPFGEGYEETVSYGPEAVAGIRAALLHEA